MIFIFWLLLASVGLDVTLSAEIKSCPLALESTTIDNFGPTKQANYVLLVPGAGSQGEELFLGHFKWGRYFDEFQQQLSRHSINSSVVPSDKYGNENIQARARRISKEIRGLAKKGHKVLLIGHSMGGLASRVAMRDKSLWPFVSGLITISSPHRGTPIVDFLLSPNSSLELVRRIVAVLGYDEKHKDYLRELSEEMAAKWDYPVDHQAGMPPVYSLLVSSSIYSKSRSVPPLVITSEIMQEIFRHRKPSVPDAVWEFEEDGLVHLGSQMWGRCLGMVDHDHGSVIGKTLGALAHVRFKLMVGELISQLQLQNLLP